MLTKNDLEQIAQIFDTWGRRLEKRLEERLERKLVARFTEILDERFTIQTDQILELVRLNNDSRINNHHLFPVSNKWIDIDLLNLCVSNHKSPKPLGNKI